MALHLHAPGIPLRTSTIKFFPVCHAFGFKKTVYKCFATDNSAQEKISTSTSEEEVTQDVSSGSSMKSQLDVLDALTSNRNVVEGVEDLSKRSTTKTKTIREQLSALIPDGVEEITITLGKGFKSLTKESLTISQKRNIRRQSYLDQVSTRNDSVLFTAIGLFVLLPPAIILGVAVVTGYVNFLT